MWYVAGIGSDLVVCCGNRFRSMWYVAGIGSDLCTMLRE